MNDCKDCQWSKRECTDDPCFKCLSGYFGRGCFVPKLVEKEAVLQEIRAKKPKKYVNKNTPLPWSS